MARAVNRLWRAIRGGEPICVWGDFDVDGQTATALLVGTLRDLGAHVSYHVPVRETASHGVDLPNLKQVIAEGARLILTCDTGVTAHEAASYARGQGVDVIITDHHELRRHPAGRHRDHQPQAARIPRSSAGRPARRGRGLQAGRGAVRTGAAAGGRGPPPRPGRAGHRRRPGAPARRHPLPAPARAGRTAPTRAAGPGRADGKSRARPDLALGGAHRLRAGAAAQRGRPAGRRQRVRRSADDRRHRPRPHPRRRPGGAERPAQAPVQPGRAGRRGADRPRPVAAGRRRAGVGQPGLARRHHRHRREPAGGAIRQADHPHLHPRRARWRAPRPARWRG